MLRLTALALALAACDGAVSPSTAPLSVDGLTLTTDRAEYDRGDAATLTLRSTGDAVWTGVLECAVLERETGGAWTDDLAHNERGCIAIALRVRPGESLSAAVGLDVPAGTYRFVHRVGPVGRGDAEGLATGPFRVR